MQCWLEMDLRCDSGLTQEAHHLQMGLVPGVEERGCHDGALKKASLSLPRNALHPPGVRRASDWPRAPRTNQGHFNVSCAIGSEGALSSPILGFRAGPGQMDRLSVTGRLPQRNASPKDAVGPESSTSKNLWPRGQNSLNMAHLRLKCGISRVQLRRPAGYRGPPAWWTATSALMAPQSGQASLVIACRNLRWNIPKTPRCVWEPSRSGFCLPAPRGALVLSLDGHC
jgi:hypothetical protein